MQQKNCLNKGNANLGIEDLKTIISREIFPNLYKLLQVVLTSPDSSTTCEHSFSVMLRIITWMKTFMLQDRLTILSIIHIEKT